MKLLYIACLLYCTGICCTNGETDGGKPISNKIDNGNTGDNKAPGLLSSRGKKGGWRAKADSDRNLTAKESAGVEYSKGQQKLPREDCKTSSKESSIQSCLPHLSARGLGNKLRRVWHRRHRKPKLAYRMAVIASISYWEFHKWSLPENVI